MKMIISETGLFIILNNSIHSSPEKETSMCVTEILVLIAATVLINGN